MPYHVLIDITNQRFGRLTVKEQSTNSIHNRVRWVCLCDCGNEIVAIAGSLRNGDTRSCGCLHKETIGQIAFKHGGSGTPENRAWQNMKTRCLNSNNHAYNDYGGRGISVCPEWRESFETFYKYMGPRPSPAHTLERNNVNGNYEPGNCRWATRTEQARNKRNTHFVDFNGKRMSLSEVAEITGIGHSTLWDRKNRGMSSDCIISKAPIRLFKVEGENISVSELAKKHGIKHATINYRLAKGMTIEEAVKPPVSRFGAFTINGESKTATEWAREYEVNISVVHRKLRKGTRIEDALGLVRYTSPMDSLINRKGN
jgi:hypothetical protein